jgi:hypothetical protein
MKSNILAITIISLVLTAEHYNCILAVLRRFLRSYVIPISQVMDSIF